MESISSVSTIPGGGPVVSGAQGVQSPKVETPNSRGGSGSPKNTGNNQIPNLSALVKELNNAVKQFNTDISFSIDKDTGKTVIKVIDTDTKEVLRQIPPEDALRVSAHIKELMGILYDAKQ